MNDELAKADVEIMANICARYETAMASMGYDPGQRIDRMIDLEKAHEACNLDLRGLLDAPLGDFLHDMVGIVRYMDRETGKLTDGFLPRFARG